MKPLHRDTVKLGTEIHTDFLHLHVYLQTPSSVCPHAKAHAHCTVHPFIQNACADVWPPAPSHAAPARTCMHACPLASSPTRPHAFCLPAHLLVWKRTCTQCTKTWRETQGDVQRIRQLTAVDCFLLPALCPCSSRVACQGWWPNSHRRGPGWVCLNLERTSSSHQVVKLTLCAAFQMHVASPRRAYALLVLSQKDHSRLFDSSRLHVLDFSRTLPDRSR